MLTSLVLSLILPTIGTVISFNRIINYHEGRRAAGLKVENGYYIDANEIDSDRDSARQNGTHYLGDIERINRPGLYGFVFGGVSFIVFIVFLIKFFEDRKRSNNAIESIGASTANS